MGDKTRVERHDGRIQKMLYKKVVLPTITYNMESTTNMTNKEIEDMEMIQHFRTSKREITKII